MRGNGKKQRQEGGDGAQQIQVAGNLIQVTGITEERAVEISRAQSRIAIKEFTEEASVEASARIEEFCERLVDDMSARGLLPAFADPGFQTLLRKAQLHAASTSEEGDYELLSKLLSERAAKTSKPTNMAISRAVEIVEYLDAAALTGMACLWLVICVSPSNPDPKTGLPAMDAIVSKVIAGGELPQGQAWLQDLELMDCVRGNASGGAIQVSLNKWVNVQLRNRPGYICEGISPADADAFRSRLNQVIPNLGAIVADHPFLPGQFRINATSSEDLIKTLQSSLDTMRAVRMQFPREALKQVNGMVSPLHNMGSEEELRSILLEARLDTVSNEARDGLLKYVESDLPGLRKLSEWWDQLSGFAGITSVGIAIGFTNVRQFDPLEGLPRLADLIAAR